MPKAVEKGVLFLSAKDLLNDGTINYTNDVKMISEDDFVRLSRKALPQKNDIIYSRIGACLGKARVVTEDIRFIVSYSCCTIRPIIIDSAFLALILDGDFVLNQAKKETQSVGVPDLGIANIKQFLIPIPPLSEQRIIYTQLHNVINAINSISKTSEEIDFLITQAKSKILDLAARGKLVPQNSDDEPASVLLERIREEKEELIKQDKIKRDKNESIIFKGDDNSYYEKIGDDVVCINDELPYDIPENWAYIRLKNVLDYEQPTPYIVESTAYSNDYDTPVLTAGKSFIIGYTDETEGIKTDLPVIIFDDFTTESKYVDFPFKVKSSAMKILTADERIISTLYAFYAMQKVECDSENHKRYWISEFSEKIIGLPPLNEQIRIINRIKEIEELLE